MQTEIRYFCIDIKRRFQRLQRVEKYCIKTAFPIKTTSSYLIMKPSIMTPIDTEYEIRKHNDQICQI